MNNVQVTVQGYGSYVVPAERVQELLNWLAANQGARLTEQGNSAAFKGKELLNG
jgi:hypothetical protein